MDYQKLLEFLAGLFFTLGIAGQLRYEGLYKRLGGISSFSAICFLLGTGALVVLGILFFNAGLTITASLGLIMCVFLIKGALNQKKYK